MRGMLLFNQVLLRIKKENGLNKMDFLTEEEYLNVLDSLPNENMYLEDSDPEKFIAKMGAECLIELLSRIKS